MDFSGKNVWVTGAGKGIGYATALAFVEAGAKVTGFDQAFAQEQYPFATEVMDVADAAQVAQVCQRLLAETERLDVLVNAAGILRMGATDQLSKEDWQQTFAVNVGGAFNLFQQTMNQFRRQRGGAIVTVASDAAHTPRIGMSAYGASKAALKSLAGLGARSVDGRPDFASGNLCGNYCCRKTCAASLAGSNTNDSLYDTSLYQFNGLDFIYAEKWFASAASAFPFMAD